MHAEANEGFAEMARKSGLDLSRKLDVLDVGGSNHNGTVHAQFIHPDTSITTLDMDGGSDITADARTWEPDRQYDVVMATELFEHVRYWPQVLATMAKAMKPDATLIVTMASDGRNPHGACGAPLPEPGEWYCNVEPGELEHALEFEFEIHEIRYRYPPGDVYAWARRPH